MREETGAPAAMTPAPPSGLQQVRATRSCLRPSTQLVVCWMVATGENAELPRATGSRNSSLLRRRHRQGDTALCSIGQHPLQGGEPQPPNVTSLGNLRRLEAPDQAEYLALSRLDQPAGDGNKVQSC